MKKILFLFLLIFTSSQKEYFIWEPAENLLYKDLKMGDVIIRKKGKNPIEWFGHVAIVGDNNKVIEFPNYKSGYNRVSLHIWIEDSRDIILLRSKEKIDKNIILKEINRHNNKKYGILHKKKSNKRFYCSQFVWYIYYTIFDKDFTDKNHFIILPYDFLYSKYFYKV